MIKDVIIPEIGGEGKNPRHSLGRLSRHRITWRTGIFHTSSKPTLGKLSVVSSATIH